MAKKKEKELSLLTEEQEKELQLLTDEISDFAINVVDDYKNNPSEISGSIIELNENSPYLYDWIKGDGWKKVMTHIPEELIQKKDKNDTE